MTALPVIVGMGGINAAGRTSFHQGYRRIVLDSLDAIARQETFLGLATLMNLVTLTEGVLKDADGNSIAESDIEAKFGEQILAGTLIRKIEKNHFDVDATPWQQKTEGFFDLHHLGLFGGGCNNVLHPQMWKKACLSGPF